MTLISIVICTRNRAGFIAACLDKVVQAIDKADLSGNAEIIIVDNGSTDATADVLNKWSASHPKIDIKILNEPLAGLSHARNRAFSEIKGNLVVFTDDDCHMAEDYILKALAYDRNDKVPVIRGGRIELGDPTDIPLTIKTSDQAASFKRSSQSARQQKLSGFISGCNMVMRKSVLDKLGNFDTHLGTGTKIPGSEDTDYLARAYLAGIDVEYVPDMTVYHFHGRKTTAQGKNLLQGYNVGAGAFFVKYLSKDINLVRPFVWNIKNAINEIKTGKSLYCP